MARRLTAQEVNAGLRAELETELTALRAKGIAPLLATVRVGNKAEDVSYEQGVSKLMHSLGIGMRKLILLENVTQRTLIDVLETLSRDPAVNGILLFQPLPERLHSTHVYKAIAPEKDVDCVTADRLGSMLSGRHDGFPRCAPAAVMALLDHYGIPLDGAKITVVGSGLVGRPLAMMLTDRLATVTVCNEYTPDTAACTCAADIVISATGVAGLIGADYVRPGQIVIDVGTTFRAGKLLGDVDMDAVDPIVAAVTPTPGGISGITDMILAKHVVQAAKQQSVVGRKAE